MARKSRLKLLLKLIYDPIGAIGEIYSEAPFVTGLIFSFLVSILYNGRQTRLFTDIRDLFLQTEFRTRFLLLSVLPQQIVENLFKRTTLPLLLLTGFLVPVAIIVSNFFTRKNTVAAALRTEYPGVVSVALFSWCATQIVVGIPALLLFNPESTFYSGALMFAPLPFFGLLLMLALRSIYHLTFGRAIAATIISLIALPALPLLIYAPFFLISTVPIIVLFWLVILLRGYFSEFMAAHSARVRFEQGLHTATLNPADSSAHYNLGRIYQQRGQEAEAIDCFQRAVEINSDELDAHYQLGRIAREQNRLSDAILHFDAVVQRDLKFAQHEIWREVGATYYAAGQYEDARTALERFLAARQSDAEGMYRYGLTLFQLGRREDCFAQMRSVIETVKAGPRFKYRTDRRWMIEAQSFLKSQAA